jgi:segregation and condensation protein A
MSDLVLPASVPPAAVALAPPEGAVEVGTNDPAAAGASTVAPPTVQLDGFAGPIDLLLALVRQQRVDLGRISVLALADQFGAALAAAGSSVPLERLAEWLVIATWLVLLKSALLLPPSPAVAEQAEREAAAEINRLEERVLMRAAADWLSERPQLGYDVFARPSRRLRRAGFVGLLEAALIVFRGPEGRPENAVYRPVLPPLWRVTDALAHLRTRLADAPADAPLTAFLPRRLGAAANRPLALRVAIASTLVAALELARDGVLTLEQEVPFATITLAACTVVTRRQLDQAAV